MKRSKRTKPWITCLIRANLFPTIYWSNEARIPGDETLKQGLKIIQNAEKYPGVIMRLIKWFFWRRLAIIDLKGRAGAVFRIGITSAKGACKVSTKLIVFEPEQKIVLLVGPEDLFVNVVSDDISMEIIGFRLTHRSSTTASEYKKEAIY